MKKHRQTMIRIPEDLREYLQNQADDNQRSLSAEILYRLLRSREREQLEHEDEAA